MAKGTRRTAAAPSQQHFRESHTQYQAIGKGSRGDTFIARKRVPINENAESSVALVVVKFDKPGQSDDP